MIYFLRPSDSCSDDPEENQASSLGLPQERLHGPLHLQSCSVQTTPYNSKSYNDSGLAETGLGKLKKEANHDEEDFKSLFPLDESDTVTACFSDLLPSECTVAPWEQAWQQSPPTQSNASGTETEPKTHTPHRYKFAVEATYTTPTRGDGAGQGEGQHGESPVFFTPGTAAWRHPLSPSSASWITVLYP